MKIYLMIKKVCIYLKCLQPRIRDKILKIKIPTGINVFAMAPDSVSNPHVLGLVEQDYS